MKGVKKLLLKAILVGLVGIFCALDSRLLGRLNFERPLIGSTLTGLALGDLQTGLMVGATLELVSLGLVHVGAAEPPDMVLGSIIASAFAILTGSSPQTALTIAIPIAVLGQMLGVAVRTLLTGFTHRADSLIDKGNFKTATRLHIIWGTLLYALTYFVPIFASIYFGTNFVKSIVDAIPDWLTDGLGVASGILPAYGFALLLNSMMTKKNVIFMLAGFFIVAYSGVDVTAVAIFAIILAFILADVKYNKEQVQTDGGNINEDDEFDDLDSPDK
jgi:mannose/fructose/N-acetylgalactosamine-specific phosphotransferase system component IIC